MDYAGTELVATGLGKLFEWGLEIFQGIAALILGITTWILVNILHLTSPDWVTALIDLCLMGVVCYLVLGWAKQGIKMVCLVVIFVLALSILSAVL